MQKNYESLKLLQNFFHKIEGEKIDYSGDILQEYLSECKIKLSQTQMNLIDLLNNSTESKLNELIDIIVDKYKEFDRLSSDLHEPFLLFIMGMKKMGKSTLVNALVGKKVAEEDIISDVWKINVYRGYNGSKNEVEILHKNKELFLFEMDEAIEYIKNEELRVNEIKEEIKLKYKMKKKEYFGNFDALNELEEEFKKETTNISNDICEVCWPTEENEFLKNFTVVDTPSLKKYSQGDNFYNVSDDYYRSDGILWMIDSRELLSNDKYEDGNMMLLNNNKNVFGVINGIDAVRETGGVEAVESVVKEAYRIYGDKFKSIVPISAKEAVKGILEDNLELIEMSGIDKLKKEIELFFLNKAKEVKINSKKQNTMILVENLLLSINSIISELKRKDIKRNELKDELELKITDKKKSMQDKLESAFDQYVETVKFNIDKKCNRLVDFGSDSYQLQYAENDIFKINDFKTDVQRLKKEIIKSLEDFYKSNIHYFKFTKFDYINEDDLYFNEVKDLLKPDDEFKSNNINLKDMSFLSKFDNSSAIIIDSNQISLLLSNTSSKINIIKSFSKKAKLPNIKQDFTSMLESITLDFKEKVSLDIEVILEEIYKSISDSIDDSFNQVYCNPSSIESILDALESLKESLEFKSRDVSIKDIIIGNYN